MAHQKTRSQKVKGVLIGAAIGIPLVLLEGGAQFPINILFIAVSGWLLELFFKGLAALIRFAGHNDFIEALRSNRRFPTRRVSIAVVTVVVTAYYMWQTVLGPTGDPETRSAMNVFAVLIAGFFVWGYRIGGIEEDEVPPDAGTDLSEMESALRRGLEDGN